MSSIDAHFGFVWPSRNLLTLARNRSLVQQPGKEFSRIHAMRRIVRTGIDATRLGILGTQIARSSFLLHHRLFVAGRCRIFRHHVKRMNVDISIGAILGAQPTSNAPILDNHFERIAAANGAHRATDHTQWIQALAAGCCYQVMVKAQPFANQSRYAVVGVRASAHACIATSAAREVQ
jgi:hypothetical protein